MSRDAPSSGVVGFDAALTVTHASGEMLRHLTPSGTLAIGVSLANTFGTEVWRRVAPAFEAAGRGTPSRLAIVADDGSRAMLDIRPQPGVNGVSWSGGVCIVTPMDPQNGDQPLLNDDRFRLLVESVKDYAILTLDPDGCVASWNPGAERFKGWSADEILGRHFSAFYPPEDIATRKPWNELVIAAEQGRLEDEGWRLRKDGSRFWANVVITALRDRDGTLRGFGKVTRDLTERRERELLLRESEAHMIGVLNAATEYSIIATDCDGVITIFNAGAERMLGYSAAEVVGTCTPAILHDADEVAARAADLGIEPGFEVFVHAALSGASETREWTYIRSDGARLPVSLTVTPVVDEADTISGFIGIARDLTEHRRDERRLREALAEYETTFVNAPLGLALAGVSGTQRGRYLAVNDAFLEIVGYSRDDLVQRDIMSILHPDEAATIDETITRLVSGELPRYLGEHRVVDIKGDSVEVEIALTVSFNDDGKPRHLVLQGQDVTSRKRYERELIQLAAHDPLTGLVNKTRFQDAIGQQLALTNRHGAPAAVLMIDLDRFKEVNDKFGHAAGDALLTSVARVLQARLRESDVIARLGGDEFGVLLIDATPSHAEQVAMELCDRIREHLASVGGPGSRVTASIGIAMLGAFENADELLAAADGAMYAAKRPGGNRIALAQTATGETPGTRTTIRSEIERALVTPGALTLFAQPIQALNGSSQTRYELLLRMVDETGAIVSPSAFLEIAERSSLIHAIDHWVVGETIDLLERCAAQGIDVTVEANLSGLSLGDESLADLIEGRLLATGIDASRLTFEVTETAAVENMIAARRFADRLRRFGCTFALDDFGSGYGSFYYLKHLPFDYLKIDGEFVQSAVTNLTDQLVIQSCVQLARGLGKETIAECVETQECLDLLRRLGVDHAQGYAIGRPAALATFGLPGNHAGSGTAGGAVRLPELLLV